MAGDGSSIALLCLYLGLVLCVQGAFGDLKCEQLDRSKCAYAVSSSGKRCVLEKRLRRGGYEEYTCRASLIVAEGLKDFVETDQCIEACGLDRNSLGISSDSLLDSGFIRKLCSSQCYHGCPNIVDLYFNLAAGEGVFLPNLCGVRTTNGRLGMAEIRSSGIVAEGPVAKVASESLHAYAPTKSVELRIASGVALPPL